MVPECFVIGEVIINLSIVQENYKKICTYCNKTFKHTSVSAVVKADGYGLGAIKVVGALFI